MLTPDEIPDTGRSQILLAIVEDAVINFCDAMMHVLKDFINLKYSELLTEEISKSN